MFHQIYEIALQTPWWVYLLFLILVKIGIKASKKNVITMKKLFIIPIVFSIMSIHTLIVSFRIDTTTISTWIGSILCGMLLGWILVRNQEVKVDKEKWLIELPGTWMTLTIILIVFISKYYFGYELTADPKLVNQSWFEFSLLFISGACTGMFIGRTLFYLRKFKTSQSTQLFIPEN